MTDSQKISVARAMADAFNENIATADDVKDVTKIAAATNTAVQRVVADTTIFDPEVIALDATAAAAAVQTAVTTIVNTIDLNTKVVESLITDSVEQVIEDTKTAVDSTVTKIVRIKLGAVTLRNASNTVVPVILKDSSNQAYSSNTMGADVYYAELSPTSAGNVATISYSLIGKNTFDAAKSYTGVSLVLDINDTLTLREATLTISGVGISVAVGDPGAVTVTLGADVSLKVAGTDSTGETVTATLTNANIVTASTNLVSLNLSALDTAINALDASTAEPLFDIGHTGKFKLNISVPNTPVVSTIKTVWVK